MMLKFVPWILATVGSAASAPTKEPYDYVIVGGGTAGLALATRLSKGLPKASILVLEAGPAALDEVKINVPGMRGAGLGSIYDWNFTTIPQPNLDGRPIDVNRGKVLGGSSALNYLCYDRASVAEYDAWGELGNKGWSWDVMIEAMTKSENFTGTDNDRHGKVGPIRSTYARDLPEILRTWKPTMNAFGLQSTDKSLGGDPLGVSFQPTNIDTTHWTRSYSANSYLPLAGSNLEVKANTRVAKIEFAKQESGKTLQAVGVVLEDGTKIAASKEVILSAGSIQSPGLLELSGVGQATVLKAANITQLLDLPGVGENYQDHIRISNAYKLKENFTSYDQFIYERPPPKFVDDQLQLWLDNKVSWFDNTSSAYAFLNWDQVSKDLNAKLTTLAKNKTTNAIDRKKLDLLSKPSVPQMELIFENNYVGAADFPSTGGKFMTLISTVMHPLSRGNVHINAKDPLNGKPVIDPAYLSNEYDVQALIEGAKMSRKIANMQPMASLWASEFQPGLQVQTEEQWRAWARKSLLSFFHPVGTCAMLPEKDRGVVDGELRVHGTRNLRVVDCSIIPVILSGHIQTAAYGIAEVAADMIIRGAQA